ncbi:HEAT repeat domain-containing protein [Anaerobaca lacustris]|uniref:HEAT repeat domain-containing protein n=1 Tax=Anaerobaca lacustris TaxID=3044600 RepID=A0AAW6U0P4_9BACT|nr:HEAT repeat domain-containing protein [Sedimentisphaerales bacterium M17dextr]
MNVSKRHVTWFVLLAAVATSAVAIGQDQAAAEAKQRELIAVLQSNAPKAEKAITCKHLVIYGDEQAVPSLMPLLADAELASWARTALEAIPGPAADEALREAMGTLQGRLLVGTINSIGVRRDARAVDGLVQKLQNADADVASAAAVALGHIGGDRAAAALTQALTGAPAGVRSAVAEGCILCAEGYMAQGKAADAVKLYDAVRRADVPNQRHLEAIRGAVLARGSDGVTLLAEQLRSDDKGRVGIALRTARELPGRNVTEALVTEMDRLSPHKQSLLLLALSDRHDDAVRPAVLKAAQSGPKELRITAIGILIRLGDVSCVPALLQAATEGDAELGRAAQETLVRLAGKDVDADLAGRLPQARGKLRQVLIELASQREIQQSLPTIVSSMEDDDPAVRAAAVQAVGVLGRDSRHVAELTRLVQKTAASSERAAIEKALLAVTGRVGAPAVTYLMPLTKSSDRSLQITGLRALAVVGGPEALGAVNAAIAGDEGDVQDEAVRILSTWPNRWPDDADAGEALLRLTRSGGKMSHQVLALRGYLQHIRGSKSLSNDQKLARVKDVRPQIQRPEEERLAIAVLGEAPTAGALELLTTLSQDAAVAEEAYSAIVSVAAADVPGLSGPQRRQALQTVLDKSANNGTKRRAQEAIKKLQ